MTVAVHGRARRTLVLALIATVAVVAALVVFWSFDNRHAPPPGYKWVSGAGITVAVPDGWKVTSTNPDDEQCVDPSKLPPSVVVPLTLWSTARATDGPLCEEYGFRQSEVARIGAASSPPFPVMPFGASLLQQVRIDGVSAVREGGVVGLGGPSVYEGFVILPSLDVSIYIRVKTQATLNTILDSVHRS